MVLVVGRSRADQEKELHGISAARGTTWSWSRLLEYYHDIGRCLPEVGSCRLSACFTAEQCGWRRFTSHDAQNNTTITERTRNKVELLVHEAHTQSTAVLVCFCFFSLSFVVRVGPRRVWRLCTFFDTIIVPAFRPFHRFRLYFCFIACGRPQP